MAVCVSGRDVEGCRSSGGRSTCRSGRGIRFDVCWCEVERAEEVPFDEAKVRVVRAVRVGVLGKV